MHLWQWGLIALATLAVAAATSAAMIAIIKRKASRLARSEDYARQRPALTKKKLRELELTAGAKPRTKQAGQIWSTNRAIIDAERALALQAEVSYQRMVTDQQADRRTRKVGASATPERA